MDNYNSSCQKWRKLVKEIFGTENITWRLEPEKGQIFFSTNGIEQIKATIIFLGMTRTNKNGVKWAWAWAGGNRNLNRIPNDNRITPADIEDYLQEGGTFEEPNLFKPECLVLSNTTEKGKYYLKYMRAKIMEMLGGQFIFEGDMNGNNAIFVILKAKKIKQIVPVKEESPQGSSDGKDEPDNSKSEEEVKVEKQQSKKEYSDEDD